MARTKRSTPSTSADVNVTPVSGISSAVKRPRDPQLAELADRAAIARKHPRVHGVQIVSSDPVTHTVSFDQARVQIPITNRDTREAQISDAANSVHQAVVATTQSLDPMKTYTAAEVEAMINERIAALPRAERKKKEKVVRITTFLDNPDFANQLQFIPSHYTCSSCKCCKLITSFIEVKEGDTSEERKNSLRGTCDVCRASGKEFYAKSGGYLAKKERRAKRQRVESEVVQATTIQEANDDVQ